MDHELPDIQGGFRKGWGTRDQIANIRWIIKKAREFQKNIYVCFIDYAKAFDCVDHNKLGEILQDMGIPDHLNCLLRIYMQVRKQQVELDMEQQTGSKQEKEYIKDVLVTTLYGNSTINPSIIIIIIAFSSKGSHILMYCYFFQYLLLITWNKEKGRIIH